MIPIRVSLWTSGIFLGLSSHSALLAEEAAAPPRIHKIELNHTDRTIRFQPYPGAQEFKIYRTDRLDQPFVEDRSGTIAGYSWSGPVTDSNRLGFYQLAVTPIDPQELLNSTVLNRITYGPTPDEIERIRKLGAAAYLEEQLAPEKIQEELEIDRVVMPSGWQFIKATGRASTSRLYLYLDAAGEGYIDDMKLVEGRTAEQGVNLIRNGDFEAPLKTEDWNISENHRDSKLASEEKKSGQASLRIAARFGGQSRDTSIWQDLNPPVKTNSTYTLSFWYLPKTDKLSSVTARFSGSGTVASGPELTPATKLKLGIAEIGDLQRWYVTHAIQSKRQLFEVLSQFVDNHFTTFYEKTRDYIDGKQRSRVENEVATELEYRELQQWRQVLLNPNGTFHDLLKISAESPSMIVYLDTVTSKKGAANENYARELMELFTMGVDNGYDQKDIEEMSRAWTGWRIEKLPPGEENNPHAFRVRDRDADPGTWALQYFRTEHDLDEKTIFRGKTVHARFGPPHAGKSYELKLASRGPSAGIQDGYDIIDHLANLPYTQEYLSVKLCQLFIHEEFVHGVYNYTDPNLSPEAALVKQCLQAWEAPAADGRKGNLRQVLRVILNSELFRTHAASRQKVKTPFEFVVSSVRALRAQNADGTYTANVSAGDLLEPMNRMGMRLFYREEPDGWSEFGQDWINTSSLIERMNFVQNFLKVGSKNSDPVGLIKLKLPPAQWRDADAVADYFVETLFLGEGRANLDLDRKAASIYLNVHEAGLPHSSPFTRLDPNSRNYETRVRSMVAMLMSLPRFQEQ